MKGIKIRDSSRDIASAREAEFYAIFQNAPICMLLVDRERQVQRLNQTTIDFLSRPAKELIGLRQGEALGCLNSLDDPRGCGFGPVCNTCKIRLTVLDTFKTGKSHRQVEVKVPFLREGKKEERSFLVSTAPVNVSGRQRVLLCMEDVTELKQMEEQLMRKEKMAVLGQFAGGVVHDLRNPLGAIKNAIYFLNLALEEPEPEVKESLEILEREVATSERIITSLLGFARAEPPSRREADMNDIIRMALTRVAIPANVEVTTTLDEALPTILADPDQLDRVFGNIILNAVQAMPEGGRLTIKLGAPNEDEVTVSVADSGVGIPEENLGEIWEPLFTTKAKGIGLGLAIAKTLVEAHGGTIEVESTVGEGTKFTVMLPSIDRDPLVEQNHFQKYIKARENKPF